MTREFRSGTAARVIAREVSPAFGRDVVMGYLAGVAIADTARKALAEAGLGAVVGVSLPRFEVVPRDATLAASADPSEVEDYPGLPWRVRAALRDFHITVGLPRGEECDPGEDLDSCVNRLLLEGELVRLVKVKPRT
ncbi:hypothetical protein ACQP2U_42435 (plasmid) [Nocardia sp. CA-084685]|uniref:hypothetical protein n=1 Tax=Nocardia sp. CA-084685 TaxID=3239970 RepID=UPI003D95FA02